MVTTSGPAGQRHVGLLVALLLLLLLAGSVAAGVLAMRSDRVGAASSRTRGSGVPISESRNLPAFHGVDLAGANTVSVRVGEPQSVVVKADDNLVHRITTRVRSGRLVIGTTGNYSTTSPTSVIVSVPALDSATLSGSGTVTIEDAAGRQLTVRLPGSGTLRASGSVDVLDVRLTGTGTAQLHELIARHVTAVVGGVGSIDVHATSRLAATVTGTGSILYAGSPSHITTHVTGTGSVTRR